MANNLSGISYTNNFSNLDGLSVVQADEIFIDGVPINTDSFIPYNGATSDVNLGTFNFQTLGQVTAKKLALAAFESTIMTSPTTSSIFTADSWGISNTVQISSLGSGSFLSTSYLTINDITNHSTLLTFQSDGIANFANTSVRVSTMATNEYDVVNLSTLTSAVAFIENVNALNYLPYTGATNNLNMGGSTITTLGQINAGTLSITSVANADYTLSVNPYDQLEFTNLSNGSIFKTNGSDLFVTGSVNCATLGATNVEAGSNIYLAKTSVAEWRTTLGMSDEYEILDNAGLMRMRLSKSTGLTVSTLNITQVSSATPSVALGLNGGGQVVSFAVPTATNILPLDNTFTGVNRFDNRVLLNTGTAQGSLTVYNSTDSLPGGGSGSALAIFAPTSTDSAIIFGCSANTTFAIRSSGSLSNPTLAIYSPIIPGMLTFTQNEATMTHGGNSFSLGNTRFLTSTVNSGVTSASVLAVSPTTISSSAGTYTALANSTTTEFRMRILANWIGGVNYTLTMVNTNWSNIKAPILITVQSPTGTTIGSATPTTGGTSQVLFTYPQGANGNIYIYIYYAPLGPTPSFSWTTLSVVANVLRSNLYSTGTALALNTTVPSFAGFALQSTGAPVGAGNGTTIENFIVGDVSAGTIYTKGYSIGFNSGSGTTIACQQTSAGSGTTFYGITSQASYHSWKSQPGTANSVDMVLDYNSGNGGIRLNKNGSSRASSNLLDVAGTISCDSLAISGGTFIGTGTIANINGGSGYAVGAGYMSAGSFTLGDHTKNYGGGVSGWNSNTAGLLFECLSNTEIAVHDGGDRVASFMYYSGNTFTIGRDMGWGGGNVSMPGIVSITGALTFGYSRYLYSPEVAGATYGSMCVKGTGRTGWAGYSIYNDSSQQVSFMMNNTAQSHGIYNATAAIWSLYVDVPNGLTYLQNVAGNTPISFGPGSWNTGGGGYTLITRALGNSTSALAFGTSPGRGVIISLTAGVVWNELILSASYIYTSCYGTINNYTNGGGWVYVSDKKVKRDIKPLKTTRSLERIMSLKPMTYKKIYHPEKSDTPIPQEVIDADHIGFLAQDVMETNPHCVSEWVDDNCVCDDDDGKRLGIAYGDINIHMVGAIQEIVKQSTSQATLVQELKKQNDAQQKEIDDLRAYKKLSEERFDKLGSLIEQLMNERLAKK